MKELLLGGHSFGGATAVAAANLLTEQPKALLLLDPWLFPIHEEIAAGKVGLRCPVQMIHSEKFHGK